LQPVLESHARIRGADVIAGIEKRLPLVVDKISVQDELARALVTCADVTARDHARALTLAREVVASRPNHPRYLTTLGIALYRDGQYRETIAALKKADEQSKVNRFIDYGFFLAMAHWKLGERELARQWFDQASGSLDENLTMLLPNVALVADVVRASDEAAELLETGE
jgi:Flp pilus assembly protein TadD